jgi:hypothetical protein
LDRGREEGSRGADAMKFLLVGQHFALGAEALLEFGLRQGARVELLAEPTNLFDANAVRVEVEQGEVAWGGSKLAEELAGYGLTTETMTWPFHLGHLGATEGSRAAKEARKAGVGFGLVAQWHKLPPEVRGSGRLLFEGGGAITVLVE